MLFPAELEEHYAMRDAFLGYAAEEFALGNDKRGDMIVDQANRLTQQLDRHYVEREANLYSLIDQCELTDGEICAAGGLVRYCRGFRIVGLNRDQAGEQYRRVRSFLRDWGIPNESVEFATRDVFLDLPLGPTTSEAAE